MTAHRILVVDDEEHILFAMKEYFTLQGFEVDVAREKKDAKELLGRIQYAAIIVDLRLTSLNGTEGFEIIRYVREQWPKTRIIVLTAYGTSEVEKMALGLGVDSFLHKPKPLREVAQIVSGLMDLKR